jgi:hypothetical protein
VYLKRICAGIGVWGLALVTPAHATFHLEKVNEVMVSSSAGDAGVQFVELLDHGGSEEVFTPVFAPYKLVIYDAAGTMIGAHMLDPTGLRMAAAADAPYLISTAGADAALAVKGDEKLDVALPPAAGQACFEANPNPPAFNCLTWGTITKPVPTNSMGSGSANGPVPPAGESDQRQSDDTVIAAAPTPKSANRTASSGGGGTTTPATAFGGLTFTARTARVDAHGRAGVRVRCPAGTDGSCTGRLALTRSSGGQAIGHSSFTVASGRHATIRVKLSAAARRRLRHGGTLSARARAVAHDAADSAKTTAARLSLVGRAG